MAADDISAARAPEGTIRVLTPADRQAFTDHMMRLDVASRRDRFNGLADDDFVRNYAARCFTGKTVVFGYVEGGAIHAAAELHHLDGEAKKGEGEIAFSVERQLQHKGIGKLLFAHLVALARHLGYRRLSVTTHPGNEAMKALARKFNAKLSFQHYETVGVIDITDAKPHPDAKAPSGLFAALAEIARSFVKSRGQPSDGDGTRD